MDPPSEIQVLLDVEIPLKRARFWSPLFALFVLSFLFGVGFTLYPIVLDAWRESDSFLLAFVGGAAVVTILMLLFARWLMLPKTPRSIRFTSHALRLPLHPNSRRTIVVPYEDVLAHQVRAAGRYSRVLVDTRKKVVHYASSVFAAPQAADQLAAHVAHRIQSLPDGASLWRAFERRVQLGRQASARRPLATYAMLGAIVAMYCVQVWSGSRTEPLLLVDLGANAPALVGDGQWYRLVTANFLHSGFLHLYLNAIALWFLGLLVERLMGASRFLIVYTFAAVGGSLASALASRAPLSVGSSTAIFGLLGSLGVLNLLFHDELPPVFRQPLRWWVLIIGINVLFPILVPQIDWAAHIGGLFAGAAVTWLLYRGHSNLELDLASRPSVTVALWIAMGLSLAGVAIGVVRALNPPDGDQAIVAEAFADDADADPNLLNVIAWSFVADRKASPRRLAAAKSVAERAVLEAPNDWALLDTLATVQYKTGDLDAAIATERRAILEEEQYGERSGFLNTQLGRFLRDKTRDAGPLRLGGVEPSDVTAALVRQDGGVFVRIDLSRSFANGLRVFALVRSGGVDLAVVRAVIPPTETDSAILDDDLGVLSALPGDAVLDVMLIDGTRCGCSGRTAYFDYWPTDRSVAALY